MGDTYSLSMFAFRFGRNKAFPVEYRLEYCAGASVAFSVSDVLTEKSLRRGIARVWTGY